MTRGSAEKKGAGEVQCTFGIGYTPLVLGVVVQHVHHTQEEETGLQGAAGVAIQAEKVSHVLPVRGGTGVRQSEEMRGHPLGNGAERKMLEAIRRVLVTAQFAPAPLLESAESGPSIKQSVQEGDGHPRRGASPGFSNGRERP